MRVRNLQPWIHALVAGATTGVLAEVLVMRLNPEVTQSPSDALVAVPLWATWGLFLGGLPLLAILAIVRRIRRGGGDWPAPQLTALVYLIAAVMSRVNANLHRELVPGSGYRVLNQDVVAWLLGAVLALAGGLLIRRASAPVKLRIGFAAVMLLLPVARLVWQPTPPRLPLEVAARPLGDPARPLLVVGVEGLDSKVLLAHAGGGRYQHLDRLQRLGTWGPFEPHRPYLRHSLWTSAATGTFPGRHGVKSQRGWQLPWFGSEPLRLLPWTPQGSRLILPWGIAERVVPPPASVAPLWERLRASGVETTVIEWPGIWGPQVTLERITSDRGTGPLDGEIGASLERALEPFSDQRDTVWRAVVRDHAVVERAVGAVSSGAQNVWLKLEALSAARRRLEPTRAMHTGEREVLDLVIELLDAQLGSLMAASGPETLVAVVSPYGLAPPNSWERLRRILGFGSSWRTSAEDCPDGLLLLNGPGVPPGLRFAGARMPDLAPTLCYLLGLPVAQYMEGRVLVEAVEREFLATHPLRVVD
jgi:hypothetical protein